MDEESGHVVEEDVKPTMSSLLAAVYTKTYPTNEAGAENGQEEEEHQEEVQTQREHVSTSTDDISMAKVPGTFGEDEGFEDFYETQHYTLICRISDKFYEAIKHIMDHRAVGVAFEGQNLGCHGTLALVQIATVSEVIIFDIMRLGIQAFQAGLKTVFESEDVMKVIHDCRWISDLLRFHYEIALVNVFDTQVADAFVCRNLNEGNWPSNVESLPDCLDKYLNFSPQDANFSQIGEPLNKENEYMWLVRPLPMELLDAAAKNAVYLLKLQRVLLAELLVEFKAAVDIYLNYCSGTVEDAEKHRGTSHLLPQAFKSIHTYIGRKSQSHNQMNQQGQSSIESQESTKVQSEPNITQEPVKKKKKMGYKKARRILLKRLQQKLKTNIEMGRDVSPNEDSTPTVSEFESGSTDTAQVAPVLSSHTCTEVESPVVDVLKHECTDSNPFTTGEENVSASLTAANENEIQPTYPSLATDPQCAGVLRMSVSLEGAQTTELVEEPNFSPDDSVPKATPSDKLAQNYRCPSGILHISKRSYKCGVCNETFPRKKLLIQHKKCHITERTYSCPVCGKTFPARIAKEHRKLHPPHGCDLCGLHFARVSQLNLHKRKHRSDIPGPFQCDDCGKTFFTKSDLLSHKISHSEDRSYKCDLCGKAFKTSKYLRNHERRHAVDKPYVCEYCGKCYAVKDDLFAHMRRQHQELFEKKRQYKCNLCEEIFPNSRRLRRHTLKHSGQRPHKCDVCFKGFALAEDLYKHKAIHTGLKPFKCDLCDRSFTRSTQLKSHNARVHLDNKTFQCDVCNKFFGIRSDLNQHKKIHAEQNPESL